MPAELKASHALLGYAMSAIKLVAPISKQLAGRHIRLRSVSHCGSDKDMIDSMKEYGLNEQHVTSVVGGDFTKDKFFNWINEQQHAESMEESAGEAIVG